MRFFRLIMLCIMLVGCTPVWQQASTSTPAPTQTTVAIAPTATSEPTLTLEPSPTAQPSPTVEPTSSPTPEITPTPKTPLTAEQRQTLFNDVWQTVNEHYLYPDFNGVDWQQVRADFEPQVQAAASDDDFYTVLTSMVEKLNDNHSRFAPPEDARQEDAISSGTDSYVGIGVLSVHEENAAFVSLVFADSPAYEAGIQRGDRIIAVDGQPFKDVNQIRGAAGTQVTVTVRSPQAEPRDITMTRRAVVGKIVPQTRRLPNAQNIGYMLIPSLFSNDMHTLVISDLANLQSDGGVDGMILDLRANGGGWRGVLEGILAQFTQGNVGTFYSQGNAYPLEIEAGTQYATYHSKPLVILIDSGTASNAEVLCGVLQEQGALVIGTPSSGNTETIFQYNFDDGSRLWVAQEGFKLLDGTNLEGKGVQPNITISDDWTQYSLPNDPAILQAIAFIDDQK